MSGDVAELSDWLEQRRTASQLRVERVPFAECADWILGDDLRHRTGRYFSVVGAQVRSGPYTGWRQPVLHQPEVGILGFAVRTLGGTTQWLVQAKTEPGNVNGTQVAPTVQATRSNYERVHGGAPTRYLEWFTRGPAPLADVTASEQGTKFWRKRNRNMVVEVDEDLEAGPSWRWVASSALRGALRADYVVNTDARSVLLAAPWELLSDDEPFGAPSPQTFRGRLAASLAASGGGDDVVEELARRRAMPRDASCTTLSQLQDWEVDEWTVSSSAHPTSCVLCVSVSATDREVPRWSQPLLASEPSTCDLWCAERDGVLQFLFRYSPEPGLPHGVELAPTRQSDILQAPLAEPGATTVHVETLQSDEGGRFYRSVCRYRIVEVDTAVTPDDSVWLPLGDIAALCRAPGTFTNEARSVLSLLLSEV